MDSNLITVALAAIFLLLVLALLVALISRHIIKVPPNTVAILSGRKRS